MSLTPFTFGSPFIELWHLVSTYARRMGPPTYSPFSLYSIQSRP